MLVLRFKYRGRARMESPAQRHHRRQLRFPSAYCRSFWFCFATAPRETLATKSVANRGWRFLLGCLFFVIFTVSERREPQEVRSVQAADEGSLPTAAGARPVERGTSRHTSRETCLSRSATYNTLNHLRWVLEHTDTRETGCGS